MPLTNALGFPNFFCKNKCHLYQNVKQAQKNITFAKTLRTMRNFDTFKQYSWLVRTIYHAKKISRERIEQLWIDDDLNDRKPLSRATFIRIKNAIEEMFGIIIKCDPKDNYIYYISNPEVLKDNSTQSWMLQTLSVNNVLIDSLSIKDRLVLEEIPGGTEYLQTIIKAIKDNHLLNITHQSFEATEAKTMIIEPYCLKLFRQRWYLLGKIAPSYDELRIFALDRITELEESEQSFEIDPNFQADNFFSYFYGTFIGGNPTRIVLRAHGIKMIRLLRTLPKHHSQQEITTTNEYSDFEYFLVPSFDFRQAILKEGSELEVLEPQSFRDEIREELKKTINRYK